MTAHANAAHLLQRVETLSNTCVSSRMRSAHEGVNVLDQESKYCNEVQFQGTLLEYLQV